MPLSYSIVEYDYSARVTITGLNTFYTDKTFYIYLDNPDSSIQTISVPISTGTWDYTYTSLSPGTEYYFKIVCYYDTGTGIDAWDGTVEDNFTTTGGGGGGIYIYNYYTNSWDKATPYIYNYYTNSWEKATPYIYNYYTNSWEKAVK